MTIRKRVLVVDIVQLEEFFLLLYTDVVVHSIVLLLQLELADYHLKSSNNT